MGRKNLNKDKVIEAAAQLVEEKGYAQLSVLELASKLGIKSASIYNYFTNLEEIEQSLGLFAVGRLVEELRQAMVGKTRGDALMALAKAYVIFARQHPAWYKSFIDSHLVRKQETEKSIQAMVLLIFEAFATFRMTEEQCVHWGRILRSTMHGFAALEGAGWFSHLPYELETTYFIAIENIIVAVEAQERSNLLENRPCLDKPQEHFVPMVTSVK